MRLSRKILSKTAIVALSAVLGFPVFGQETRWKLVGRDGIELGLAGPAGSAVSETWFSRDGATLYVLLHSGVTWATADLGETWFQQDAIAEFDRVNRLVSQAADSDSAGSIVRDPFGPATEYSLGRDLLRSHNGGKSWVNLTNDNPGSVIGEWQSGIAFSPIHPDFVVVGNSMGLWKSVDRGITWSSLNRKLPNFPRAEFLPMNYPGGIRIEAASMGTLELSGMGAADFWQLRQSPEKPLLKADGDDAVRRSPEALLLPKGFDASYRVWKDEQPISPDLTSCAVEECQNPSEHFVTALGSNGHLWVGTSDGRIWVSRDDGEDWLLSFQDSENQRVQEIWVDPENALAALAIAGTRVLRSTNGGVFWDDIASNLPAGVWTSIVGRPEARGVYLAGAEGVFHTQIDLDKPGPIGVWQRLSGNLPAKRVDDLMVDFSNERMYAVQEGYGVYQAGVPAAQGVIQALNAADLSNRPASPGSLITIRGVAADYAQTGNLNAPILSRGLRETQLQVPFGQVGNTVEITLWSSLQKFELSAPFAKVSPVIFIEDGDPLAFDAGSGAIVSRDRPARPGSKLLIMATGLGRVVPDWPTGFAAPLVDPPKPIAKISATLNGAPLNVIGSRLASGYVGTYIVELELPTTALFGVGVLKIYADGISSNAAELIIEP